MKANSGVTAAMLPPLRENAPKAMKRDREDAVPRTKDRSRTDRRARIRVDNQHVTLGTFDGEYLSVAVEAARCKKIELSGGARHVPLTDDIKRQLREAADAAVRERQRLVAAMPAADLQDVPAALPKEPWTLPALSPQNEPFDSFLSREEELFVEALYVDLGEPDLCDPHDLGDPNALEAALALPTPSLPPSAPNSEHASTTDAPTTAHMHPARDLDRRPAMKVTQIEVAGMCCQSEVTLVHKKLGAMEGVSDINVNLMLRRIAVTHDPDACPPARMLRALNWSLLGASLVEAGSGTTLRRGTLYTKETLLLITSFILFAAAGGMWARPAGTPWFADPFTYFGIACVCLGAPVLIMRAAAGLYYQRTINMFCTMVLAVVGAVALLDFWEAAAIVFFFVASEWLQQWCVHHTADMSRGLGGMLPQTVSPADGSDDKPLSAVALGDLLLVKPGCAVPVDGEVAEGASSVDESMLTGESMPVSKSATSLVFAGTTNQMGVLVVKTTRLPDDCSASKITQMVASAQTASSKEMLLERFAKVYTLLVLLTALALATVPLGTCTWAEGGVTTNSTANMTPTSDGLDSHSGHLEGASPAMCAWWLRRAIALVVLSCPCSLIVAMPVTYACGVSALARWGILIKSQSQMELLARMHTLCLDKTGTLTEGRFRLRQIAPNRAHPRMKDDEGLRRLVGLVAAAEKNSSHPIAEAFLEFADGMGVDPTPARDFSILEGEGIRATVDGETVHVGSERMARRLLAEAAQTKARDRHVRDARRALADASATLMKAELDKMPTRMIASLRKGVLTAREALEAADAAGRLDMGPEMVDALAHLTTCRDHTACIITPEMRSLTHLISCDNHKACGGCAPKSCCLHGGSKPCNAQCCHRSCCGKPCEHTGPCPHAGDETTESTGTSDTGCCGHDHGHAEPAEPAEHECCGHDHGHAEPAEAQHECCGHDHGHAEPAEAQHEHSHGGAPCTHDHGHADRELTLASPNIAQWSAAGASVLWIVLDGKLAAAVQVSELTAACQLSDLIRSETPAAMAALRSLGVATMILTGDAEGTVQAVRAQAGIENAISGMMPQEKLAVVQQLASKGVVGMVGDGVNDGPALAAADVGIAMGVGGTALASQAAGVVLMSNDLRRLGDAIVGARLTIRVLRVSLGVALLLKLLPLILIFTLPAEAESFLIAAAVGSDLLGIVFVLCAAMSLLGARARFATTPCSNSDNSLEGPALVSYA